MQHNNTCSCSGATTTSCSTAENLAATQLHMQLQQSIAMRKLAGPSCPQVTGTQQPCSWTPLAYRFPRSLLYDGHTACPSRAGRRSGYRASRD